MSIHHKERRLVVNNKFIGNVRLNLNERVDLSSDQVDVLADEVSDFIEDRLQGRVGYDEAWALLEQRVRQLGSARFDGYGRAMSQVISVMRSIEKEMNNG